MIPALLAALGVVLVSVGLSLSPVPWLTFVWLGGVLCAAGLLVDFEEER